MSYLHFHYDTSYSQMIVTNGGPNKDNGLNPLKIRSFFRSSFAEAINCIKMPLACFKISQACLAVAPVSVAISSSYRTFETVPTRRERLISSDSLVFAKYVVGVFFGPINRIRNVQGVTHI